MNEERTYEHLLSVRDLHTSFQTENGEVQAVNGVHFNLDEGRVLGIVGESGSGKSVTAYSVMQILADNGRVTKGQVLFKGEDDAVDHFLLPEITRENTDPARKFLCELIQFVFSACSDPDLVQ